MRLRKRLFWLINFSVLGLFSVYALSGAFGIGTKHAYAAALEDGNFYKKSKNFVVVHNDMNAGGSQGSVSSDDDVICSLNPTQAAELDAFFKVNISNITVSNGDTVQLAAVSGHHLTRHELLNFLKASNQSLDCRIIGTHHIFFLPVLPQIS